MIENTPYNDNLDKYLLGKLSAEDKSAMDAQFAADSHLKEDMLLQQDIVHALQDERRLELKNRLNNIEVGAGGFSSAVGLKIAAGVALVGLLGTAAFFYFNETPAPTAELPVGLLELPPQEQSLAAELPAKPVVTITAEDIRTEEKVMEETNHQLFKKVDVLASGATTSTPVAKSNKSLQTQNTAHVAPKTEERPQIMVQKPQVLSDFSESEMNGTQQSVEVPVDAMARNREFSAQTIEVTTQLHDKWDFHYQFYDSKLFIYGDFKNKPYEILEINTEGNTNYYLYFEKQYYGLKNNQQKLSRLRKLTNEKLIKELEITRNQKN